MGTTIYKYRVPFPAGTLEIPLYGAVLALQMQGGAPTLWVLVDPADPKTTRAFRFYGTGHNMPDDPGAPVGTVQFDDGTVWHLFEPVAA